MCWMLHHCLVGLLQCMDRTAPSQGRFSMFQSEAMLPPQGLAEGRL